MTKEQQELENIAMSIIERMKLEKEMGSTDWEKMAGAIKKTLKETLLAVEILKDVKAVVEMTEYAPKAIRLTYYGWNFPGFPTHREIEKSSEEKNKQLLDSAIHSNKWSPRWAALAALFALGSLATSIFTATNDEKLSPALQDLNTTLQNQEQRIESIAVSLKGVETAIVNQRSDSLNVRLEK